MILDPVWCCTNLTCTGTWIQHTRKIRSCCTHVPCTDLHYFKPSLRQFLITETCSEFGVNDTMAYHINNPLEHKNMYMNTINYSPCK